MWSINVEMSPNRGSLKERQKKTQSTDSCKGKLWKILSQSTVDYSCLDQHYGLFSPSKPPTFNSKGSVGLWKKMNRSTYSKKHQI